MCFGPDAVPPAPPQRGKLDIQERRTVSAADGSLVAATLATTTAPDPPGIVVLPDVRGLHPYYEEFLGLLAGAGMHAVGMDLYSRTAGPYHRDEGFDYVPHRAVVTDANLVADAAAGATVLRNLGCGRIFALGFCFGGRAALLQAAEPGWSGAAGFYPWPTRVGPEGRSPLEDARAGQVRAPVLVLYGGADEKITAEDRTSYAHALEEAGVTATSITFEGAPHSFFDRHKAAYAEACHEAWSHLIDFVG